MLTRPRVAFGVVLAGVALTSATPARAQVTLSADATRATVHYDGYQRSPVWLVSPMARLERPVFTLAGRGSFAFFPSGNESTDLLFSASLFPPTRRSWRPEVTVVGGLSRYIGINTGYGSASVRAHRVARSAGFWLGASATSVTGSTDNISGARGEIGGWARFGLLTTNVVSTITSVTDIRYVDTELQARYTRSWLELAGGTGARGGGATLGLRVWGDLSATVWLTRQLALVASHGGYPSDPSQLSPGGRYTSVSMRIATRPPAFREALSRTIAYPTPSIVRPVVATFDVDRGRDGRTRIRIRAADARTVELMGDFTDWEPVALARTRGDRWEVVLPISRGTHQINVRVNGAEWGVPPGVGTAADDFGGVVGLLIIA